MIRKVAQNLTVFKSDFQTSYSFRSRIFFSLLCIKLLKSNFVNTKTLQIFHFSLSETLCLQGLSNNSNYDIHLRSSESAIISSSLLMLIKCQYSLVLLCLESVPLGNSTNALAQLKTKHLTR